MATAMTPLSRAAIIDTNVFVYALYPASPHYRAAFHLREQAQDPTAEFYVTAQILADNADDFVRYTGIEVVRPLAPRRL